MAMLDAGNEALLDPTVYVLEMCCSPCSLIAGAIQVVRMILAAVVFLAKPILFAILVIDPPSIAPYPAGLQR